MVIFFRKLKKYNEIQLTKNKMDLNIRKMTNHPPSPAVAREPLLKHHEPLVKHHGTLLKHSETS